jgi:glycosyltransferase involved in cell wall biosynthesis
MSTGDHRYADPTADPRISVVIPARDKAAYLSRCVGSIVAAAEHWQNTEILLFENGSRDSTAAMAEALFGSRIAIVRSQATTAGAARNVGAARATGDTLCFLDADVLVPLDFFRRLAAIVERFPEAAVGCTVSLPTDGSWIERVWGSLHERGVSGEVTLLNGACLAIPIKTFRALGGFRSDLITGEDADLCLRHNEAGGTNLELRDLRTIHLDNPRTLAQFFDKETWRGLGALATVRRDRLDRPFFFTIIHGLLLTGALVLMVTRSFDLVSVVVALALMTVVPLIAVAYRIARAEHPPGILPSLVLYQVYFLARLRALFNLALGRGTP